MTGRRGNPLVLRKILPNPDLVIASTGADIGFYIVSLVGQVIIKVNIFLSNHCPGMHSSNSDFAEFDPALFLLFRQSGTWIHSLLLADSILHS